MSDEQIYQQAFELWNINKDRVGNWFSGIRGSQKHLELFESIGLFLRLISKFNNIEYNPNWNEIDFSQYKFTPINFVERISFVTSRPTQYQSYIQLVGLFEEFEKIIYKQLAIEKSQES